MANKKLAIGQSAPDFQLPIYSEANGESTVKLSDLKGQVVMLAFYPRDNTPGCTKEMCAFRDDYSEFTGKGVQVFGVSKDSIKSHTTFTTKFNMGKLPLISAKDSDMLDQYGTDGIILKKRTLYIIDKEGKIADIIEGMPNNQDLLKKVSKL